MTVYEFVFNEGFLLYLPWVAGAAYLLVGVAVATTKMQMVKAGWESDYKRRNSYYSPNDPEIVFPFAIMWLGLIPLWPAVFIHVWVKDYVR